MHCREPGASVVVALHSRHRPVRQVWVAGRQTCFNFRFELSICDGMTRALIKQSARKWHLRGIVAQ